MDPEHQHPNAELLQSATKGFDYLFSNDIVSARQHFERRDDPFHLMGLGVCAFLEAALGMETGLMTEASRCLSLSEAGARKQMRVPKPRDMSYESKFSYGLEWEILNADAIVLLGLTHALRLYKTVFPVGLPHIPSSRGDISISPSLPAVLKHKPSMASLASESSTTSASSAATIPTPAPAIKSSFFSKWVGASSTQSLPITSGTGHTVPDGPVEDLIIAGTAFGFGLFNLVFSLLPKKIQGVVGFLGFKHDRKLALQALSLAASKYDVHGVFAGLVLMTYHGAVLLFSGYQANENKILAEYKDIVDRIESRYPEGALWVLNRAKILRMSYDPQSAIKVLQDGLKPDRTHSFVQADMLLIFELAWTLLGQRRYQEASDAFMKITELNSWSHGTYYFIAAGCQLALGNKEKAQSMLDAILDLIEKKKISGKDLPTEVFIKKKLAFYKEKQARRGGAPEHYVDSVKINPAEVWNNHSRVGESIARAHINALKELSPHVHISKITLEASSPTTNSLRTPRSAQSSGSKVSLVSPADVDLDTSDELAIRALMLGINYRTIKEFEISRGFLNEAYGYQNSIKVSTWVGGVAAFELAVLDLKEAEDRDSASPVVSSSEPPTPASGNGDVPAVVADAGAVAEKIDNLRLDSSAEGRPSVLSPEARKKMWIETLKSASTKLDLALNLAGSSIDLSSRLDSRIAMLRDEIAAKTAIIGVSI
ncbi:Inclusion body clearance protein IML2 [Psilocybe cubensis]|uniref:Inclusion body clearance protein IML2 n=1 Tax=Psilocybe cubensis TaxID=181762 RepID=A0ACB8HAA9_PSICU|nr:Inclusion body clearance protein IML2 [Psilocybe cubensis]KAH9484607.1 Inclusion body clearance protein IML2 [Psilocybe cubensis]